MITEAAPAKINLALHVTGQRDDGYHLLETIVTFADPLVGNASDVVRIAPLAGGDGPAVSLNISGPEAWALSEPDDNLVVQAVTKLIASMSDAREFGFVLQLEKNLPVASGIGGGSTDAAAALRAVMRQLETSLDADKLLELALSLGADVPMCLPGSPAKITGIGERIEPVRMPSFHMVLVNPRVAVSTPDVFRALSDKDNEPLPDCPVSQHVDDWVAWLADTRNDLQLPAMTIAPEIASCLQTLEASGAVFARMSGSGATCFGIFDTLEAAKAATDDIQRAQPDWWVSACRTIEGS